MDLPVVEVPDDDAGRSSSRAAAGIGIPRAGCGCGCLRPLCEWDSCTHLTGRQERFASKACKDAFYDTCRPRVLNASAGAPRERDLLTEWLALMSDGEARDCMQMAVDLKCLPQSASATLRRARAKGFRVVSDLPNGCVVRAHRYRLLLNGEAR